MRRDVFQAIADPTRREILKLLAAEHMTLNTVAENFDVSRPAISKHIKILTESGLVKISPRGRERYCSVNHEKLREVSDWVKYFEAFWDNTLLALKQFVEDKK